MSDLILKPQEILNFLDRNATNGEPYALKLGIVAVRSDGVSVIDTHDNRGRITTFPVNVDGVLQPAKAEYMPNLSHGVGADTRALKGVEEAPVELTFSQLVAAVKAR